MSYLPWGCMTFIIYIDPRLREYGLGKFLGKSRWCYALDASGFSLPIWRVGLPGTLRRGGSGTFRSRFVVLYQQKQRDEGLFHLCFLEARLLNPQWESFQPEKEPVLAAALTTCPLPALGVTRAPPDDVEWA